MADQEKTRVLIHYICVAPELRRHDFATALMKSVFRKNEYYERVIMAVTSLPKCYVGDGSDKTMVNFFTQFGFKDMLKKI